MATRKSRKIEQVETQESESNVIDLCDPKQVAEEFDKMSKVETIEPVKTEEPVIDFLNPKHVEMIQDAVQCGLVQFRNPHFFSPSIDEMNTQDIKDLMAYCEMVIMNRKSDELVELDRQISELKAKRAALVGTSTRSANGGNRSYTIRPIINPNDPSQVYTTGKHPQWLKDLVEQEMTMNSTKTSKAILDELRGN